jgi:hypothetical protein
MKRSPGPRKTANLSASLHQRLNIYALSAGAAGVSMLALVPPAEGRIVYTKTHQVIGTNGVYPLDLNQDGTIDFLIQQIGYPSYNNGLWVKEAFGNAVEGLILSTSSFRHYLAAALKKGTRIDPQQTFITNTNSFGESMVRVECDQQCSTRGQWVSVKNRYLGLKFRIDGKNHYGWARLSTQLLGQTQIGATLTGYAYETTPGKGIRAGQICCDAKGAVAEPSTPPKAPDPTLTAPASRNTPHGGLGRLALGAGTMSSWRQP